MHTQVESDDTVTQLRGLVETGDHERLLEVMSEVVSKVTRENALLRGKRSTAPILIASPESG